MKNEIIFPVLILAAGFVYFIIPKITKKYFTRPKIFIEVNANEGIVRGRRHIARISNDKVFMNSNGSLI